MNPFQSIQCTVQRGQAYGSLLPSNPSTSPPVCCAGALGRRAHRAACWPDAPSGAHPRAHHHGVQPRTDRHGSPWPTSPCWCHSSAYHVGHRQACTRSRDSDAAADTTDTILPWSPDPPLPSHVLHSLLPHFATAVDQRHPGPPLSVHAQFPSPPPKNATRTGQTAATAHAPLLLPPRVQLGSGGGKDDTGQQAAPAYEPTTVLDWRANHLLHRPCLELPFL